MGNKKGNILLTILVAIAVVAALVGGYFWWTSKTTVPAAKQTSDLKPKEATHSTYEISWNTVKVPRYEFSFKIPEKWGIVTNMNSGEFIPVLESTEIESGNVFFITNSKDYSFNSTVPRLVVDLGYPPKIPTRETIVLTKYGNDPGILDQILSTFKFLDSEFEISEADTGKTRSYLPTSRFSISLDQSRHPLAQLLYKQCNNIGYVSNLSANGPNSYPIGFEVTKPGTCKITNNDFWIIITVPQGLAF